MSLVAFGVVTTAVAAVYCCLNGRQQRLTSGTDQKTGNVAQRALPTAQSGATARDDAGRHFGGATRIGAVAREEDICRRPALLLERGRQPSDVD